MKRIIERLSALAMLSAVALTSCQKDRDLDVYIDSTQGNKINISGSIDQEYTTRVTDEGFCDGDDIGIYIVDYLDDGSAGTLEIEGNRADNVKFTYDEEGNSWSSSTALYFKDDKTNIDLVGYYPYGTPTSIDSYGITVEKDQSQGASYGIMGGYEASDFLWGKVEAVSPSESIIRVVFNHMMASVKVTLIEGDGFDSGEWSAASKQILVNNTARTASVDLSTGVVTAGEDVESTGIMPYVSSDEYRAIVAPQSVAAGLSLFSITIDGTAYNFTRSEEMEYVASKLHNFTISVDKKEAGDYEFTLTSESITVWESDPVSHDATAKEYIVVDVAEAGTLADCIAAAGQDYSTILNLKVTGQINYLDFVFMRDDMTKLQALNLKEVEIAECYYYTTYAANEIPASAMSEKTSLLRLTLPENITKINSYAFYGCTYITGSLIIPEGVTEVGNSAFNNCTSMMGTLSLPSTLETIGSSAFSSCGFICELTLPAGVTSIGSSAFSSSSGFYGNLILPDGLTIIEGGSFASCGFTGSLTIPSGVTSIGSAFTFCDFDGTLTLPEGLENIGTQAFDFNSFKGELTMPSTLLTIGAYAFRGNSFSGTLVIPESVVVISEQAFYSCQRLSGTLVIPETVLSLGASAFSGCKLIEGVELNSKIENIPSSLFENCFGISSFKCLSVNPPYVASGAFDGVPKDNFTLEVPEASVAQYQTTAGWADFKSISAYENFSIERRTTSLINTAQSRELTLDADAEWEVSSCPEWITVTPSSGSLKTLLTLDIGELPKGDADRTGEVVFKLKDKEYTSTHTVNQYDYDYAEDELVTLQSATQGAGVDIVIIGDGFNGEDISSGLYLSTMTSAMENFFGLPPYDTYRDYFNVYTAIAVSPESGIGSVNTIIDTRFGVTYTGGVGLGHVSDQPQDDIFDYVEENTPAKDLDKTLIIMVPNSGDYGGICYMWSDGAAIAYCPMLTDDYPYDFRGIIQHEAGGHGFGKLGDEYIYMNAFIDACTCSYDHTDELNYAHALGWFQNLSLTGKVNEVPWSEFIYHENYSAVVDIYEGGFFHTRNVYRSESNSCMNNNVSYYSAVSRREMVKRIMEYAGEEYTFEKFVANDDLNAGSTITKSVSSSSTSTVPSFTSVTKLQANPQFMGKRKK